MYEFVNVNPCKKRLGDCVVRAISLALNQSWYRTAIDLCIEGLIQCDMQDSNSVWRAYLQSKGFKKYPILDTLTFEEFTTTHSKGLYVVGTGSHVAAVRDGVILDNDARDSSRSSSFFACSSDIAYTLLIIALLISSGVLFFICLPKR